jgi:xanthine dehydrogenase accessory factor
VTETISDADILRQAARWRADGRGVALATVIETWGSAPRPVGAHLVVDDRGMFFGSVSGGCVEGDVITAAQDAIADGAPRLLAFGVADETAWRAGLSCGGRIVVQVARLERPELLDALAADLAARRACAMVTPLDGGLSSPDPWLVHSADGDDRLGGAVQARLASGASGVVTQADGRYFVNVHWPAPRLVIIGAVHVAQALAAMARRVDFDVIVVDPRQAFAESARFADVRLVADWPDAAFDAIGLDAFCAVAALTHDPRIDDIALRRALAAPCFYVGALGSRRTQAQRVERLAAAGVTAAQLARLRAPIGLDIGAATPAEIAVAILAEIIAARRGAGAAA